MDPNAGELSSAERRIFERVNENVGRAALNRLPAKFVGLRDHQDETIGKVVDAFNGGADVVVLDAPPGSGKTVIAESVRLMLECSGLYVCHSKALQDQFVGDFDYAAVVKGRSNYPTEIYGESFPAVNAADCSGGDCGLCSSSETCPYQIAKQSAIDSELAVVNTSYFLTECNGPHRFSGRELVVLDECDVVEKELLGFVEARITRGMIERYKLGGPEYLTKPESWRAWIVAKVVPRLRAAMKTLDRKDHNQLRRYNRMKDLCWRLTRIADGLDPENESVTQWVGDHGEHGWVFKPVTVNEFGGRLLWPHGKKWLLMSGSVGSTDFLLTSLGLYDYDPSVKVESFTIPSTFPVSSRRIIVSPSGSLSKKSSEQDKEKVYGACIETCIAHPNERILVHTVSHYTAEEVRRRLQGVFRGDRPVFVCPDSSHREGVVAEWQDSDRGVFCSPSMDRGVDLAGDKCRVQIVLKLPLGNLGDKQVSARLYSKSGRVWYALECARALTQMVGRVTRNEEDWGVTYVLDKEFVRFWREWKHLFPNHFREAVTWG